MQKRGRESSAETSFGSALARFGLVWVPVTWTVLRLDLCVHPLSKPSTGAMGAGCNESRAASPGGDVQSPGMLCPCLPVLSSHGSTTASRAKSQKDILQRGRGTALPTDSSTREPCRATVWQTFGRSFGSRRESPGHRGTFLRMLPGQAHAS